MKRYLVALLYIQLGLSLHINAQNIPTGISSPVSRTPVKTPVAPSASVFYERVFAPNIPITDSSLINLSASVNDIAVTTEYIDGLGRPLEIVRKQASPLKKDVIIPTSFDDLGNVTTSYLPYIAQTGNYNDGKFKATPYRNDSSFYAAQFPNEDIYYGKTLFDASPLNHTTKHMSAGNSWTGSNVGISSDERANTLNDSVRQWLINITSENDIPTTTAIYGIGRLFETEIIDERGTKTINYTDEIGRTVLTKTQVSGTYYSGHTGWLCTYYIYDEMNHLRMVLPPKAVNFLLANNWNLAANTDIIDDLCYSYWYDSRGRVIEKHIPGKGKTYIAYDLQDRIVMMQDEKLRTTNQWTFTKYDGQSRPDSTGLITSSLTQSQIIANAAASQDYPTVTGTYSLLVVNYYDNYSWISGSIPSGTLTTTNINSANFITTYNTSPNYARQIVQSSKIRGLVTGSRKLVLGTSTYLYSVNIYDERNSLIQVKQTNFSGGTDIATNQYDFSGEVLRNHLQHQKLGNNTINHTLLTKYAYDHAGRLTTLIKNIDGLGDKTITQNVYNELGQLSTKTLGQMESQNLTYNIRGWLNGINKDYVETANSSTNYFGEEVFYDFGFTANQPNGNIAGVKWKSTGDDIQRAYGFTYDKTNRLLSADFTQQNKGSTAWTNDLMDFSVSGLKYDPSGNIAAMNQRGVNVNIPVDIDSLTYTYFTNSNQLQKIKDKITDLTDWGDFKDTSLATDDYAYDENGNLVKDNNKHIHTTSGGNGVSYNFLDKPDNINVNGKGNIAYTYDATGGLLQKTINDSKTNIKTVITYIAGFVYQKILPSTGNATSIPDTLQYVLHEEGRIRWSITQSTPTGSFVYDYFLKDHLNNIRSVITDEQDVVTYPIASLEAASLNNEKVYYDSLDVGRTDKQYITGYPTDNYTNPNNFIQKLNGNGPKIGASILLKVMAGDKISVHASSWFNSNATPGTPVSPLTDIVNALLGTIPSASGSKILQQQLTGSMISPDVTQFLNIRNRDNYVSTLPKAFLNIVLFDEQMNPIITTDGKNSYFQQVTDDATQVSPFTIPNREMAKSGYVYIFVSNETPNINVFFDNLQVTHTKGPLLQENGYYPFGLEMKALSSQAALKPQTRYKYNAGTELEDNFNVDYYETPFRNYDHQVGRFSGIDLLAELTPYTTPYCYGDNDPNFWNDPMGLSLIAANQLPDVTVTGYKRAAVGPFGWGMYSGDLSGGIGLGFGGGGGGLTGGNGGYGAWSSSHGGGGGSSQSGGGGSNLDGPGKPKPKQAFIGPNGLIPIITLSTTKTVLTELPKPTFSGFWGPVLTVLSYTLSLHGDNVSTYDILKKEAVNINTLIAQGKAVPNKIQYEFRGHKNDDEIVFRYLSLDELNSVREGNLLNKDALGNFVPKFVSPDLYLTSKQAKSLLALPVAPGYVVWTFKSLIQATLVGWTPADPKNGESGGGLEGTIFQLFPVMGVFQLK